MLPVIEGLAGAGAGADLDRHLEGRGRGRGARAGATLVNDVTALRGDPEMAEVVARQRRATAA